MNGQEVKDTYRKTIGVIKSCKTYPQLVSAARYVNLFYKKYRISETAKEEIRKAIAKQKIRVRLNGSKTQKDNKGSDIHRAKNTEIRNADT